jgi:hypothetical protein
MFLSEGSYVLRISFPDERVAPVIRKEDPDPNIRRKVRTVARTRFPPDNREQVSVSAVPTVAREIRSNFLLTAYGATRIDPVSGFGFPQSHPRRSLREAGGDLKSRPILRDRVAPESRIGTSQPGPKIGWRIRRKDPGCPGSLDLDFHPEPKADLCQPFLITRVAPCDRERLPPKGQGSGRSEPLPPGYPGGSFRISHGRFQPDRFQTSGSGRVRFLTEGF